jgi:hypothetical protein
MRTSTSSSGVAELNHKIKVFGVDRDTAEVVVFSGDRYPVEAWYDPLGNECEGPTAVICVFKGPAGFYFAVDMRDCMLPLAAH